MRFIRVFILILLLATIFLSTPKYVYSDTRCPSYKGTEPPNPTVNDDVTLIFADAVDVVHIIKVDNKSTFSINPGENQVNIGQLTEGSHRFSLKPVPTGAPGSLQCYLIPFTVWSPSGPPPPPPPGLSGKNPCEGGVCKTALGDIPTNPTAFAQRVLEIAIGLGGGLALILMVIGAIKVLTSTGDQQKLNAGRDMIVAAVAGLLFIIFSMLILRFIGIQIFGGGLVG